MMPFAEWIRFGSLVTAVKRWRISTAVEMKRYSRLEVPPIPRKAPPSKCWCGHYVKNHRVKTVTHPYLLKEGCQVYDCPCEKAMDPTIVVCTKCLQIHPAGECPMPEIVGGVSQGVLVNFKPAKDKDGEPNVTEEQREQARDRGREVREFMERKIPPDKPNEGGTLKVTYYSVYCEGCGHPSMWHDILRGCVGAGVEGCRGFDCSCKLDVPGEPVSPYCECGHPTRWHDKAGPRCTAVNCSCGRTAA